MLTVAPFCHHHNLAMRLVPEKVKGLGSGDIWLYACPLPDCERRYIEECNGYGRISEKNEFLPVAAWGH
jgi:hypothetical protein